LFSIQITSNESNILESEGGRAICQPAPHEGNSLAHA